MHLLVYLEAHRTPEVGYAEDLEGQLGGVRTLSRDYLLGEGYPCCPPA